MLTISELQIIMKEDKEELSVRRALQQLLERFADHKGATIASLNLIGRSPKHGEIEIKIEIGAPYRWREDPDGWRCAVSMHPIVAPNFPGGCGSNALQSLCLAVGFVQWQLRCFVAEGGLLFIGGKSFCLEDFLGLQQTEGTTACAPWMGLLHLCAD